MKKLTSSNNVTGLKLLQPDCRPFLGISLCRQVDLPAGNCKLPCNDSQRAAGMEAVSFACLCHSCARVVRKSQGSCGSCDWGRISSRHAAFARTVLELLRRLFAVSPCPEAYRRTFLPQDILILPLQVSRAAAASCAIILAQHGPCPIQ